MNVKSKLDDLSGKRTIPTDLGKFRVWADRECGAWDAATQLAAFHVVMGQLPIEEFKKVFAERDR